jgi:hypothetical protein
LRKNFPFSAAKISQDGEVRNGITVRAKHCRQDLPVQELIVASHCEMRAKNERDNVNP